MLNIPIRKYTIWRVVSNGFLRAVRYKKSRSSCILRLTVDRLKLDNIAGFELFNCGAVIWGLMSSCLLIILDVLGPLFLGLPVDFFWSGISPSGDSRNNLVYRCTLLKLTPVRLCISLLEWPAWHRLVPAAICSQDKCLLLPIYLYLQRCQLLRFRRNLYAF